MLAAASEVRHVFSGLKAAPRLAASASRAAAAGRLRDVPLDTWLTLAGALVSIGLGVVSIWAIWRIVRSN